MLKIQAEFAELVAGTMVKSQQGNAGDANGPMKIDLKALRESRGLTLEDVFNVTRISVLNIEAIEKGEFNFLPSPVYARAYIKTYARLLDVDEKEVLGHYEKYLATVAGAEISEPVQKEIKFSYKKLIIVSFLLIAACGLFYIVYLCSGYRTVNVPTGIDIGAKTQVKSTSAPNNVVSPEKTETMEAVIESVPPGRLVVTARETTWLRIKEEGKPDFEILMKPGEKLEREASQLSMDVGNAGGISVEFDGKIMEDLGRSGEVVHLRLP